MPLSTSLAFRATVDNTTRTITEQPTFVFGGVVPGATRVPVTEMFIMNKDLTLPATFTSTLACLEKELQPSTEQGFVRVAESVDDYELVLIRSLL